MLHAYNIIDKLTNFCFCTNLQTRLQAQAAGVAYSHPMSNMTSRMAVFGPNMVLLALKCSFLCGNNFLCLTLICLPWSLNVDMFVSSRWSSFPISYIEYYGIKHNSKPIVGRQAKSICFRVSPHVKMRLLRKEGIELCVGGIFVELFYRKNVVWWTWMAC